MSTHLYFGRCAGLLYKRSDNPLVQLVMHCKFRPAISCASKTMINRKFISTNNSTNATKASTKNVVHGTLPRYGINMEVGQFAELCRSFSQEDVFAFGTLIGDMNPVHFPDKSTHFLRMTDEYYEDEISYNRPNEMPIVHGMLLSSLFSAIFGTLIPGAIYRSQSLKFNNSVYVGEHVIARVTVRKLRQVSRNNNGVLCSCDTTVVKGTATSTNNTNNGSNEVIAVSGTAQVWLPGATVNTRSS